MAFRFLLLLISAWLGADDARADYNDQDLGSILEVSEPEIAAGHDDGGLEDATASRIQWFRIVINETGLKYRLFLFINSYSDDRVILYRDRGKHLEKLGINGIHTPASQRDIQSRLQFLALPFDSGEKPVFYLKMQSFLSLNNVMYVMTEKQAHDYRVADGTFYGIFYGTVLAMFGFAFVMFLGTREGLYLAYMLFILSMGYLVTMLMSGATAWMPALLGPTNRLIICVSASTIFTGSIHFFLLQFLRVSSGWTAMNTAQRAGILSGLLVFLFGLSPISLGLYLFGTTGFFVLATWQIVKEITRNNPHARVMALSWFPVSVGGIINMAQLTIEGFYTNWFTINAYVIGATLGTGLISIFFAADYLQRRREKDEVVSVLTNKERAENSAAAIQEALVHLHPDTEHLESDFLYMPAEKVGGDLLVSAFSRDGLRYYYFIGDITGHDLSSALLSVHISGLIRAAINHGDHRDKEPEEVLWEVLLTINDALMPGHSRSTNLLTLGAMAIDLRRNSGAYISAGHHEAWIRSHDKVTPLQGRSSILGASPHPILKCMNFPVAKGDSLFLYTDGLVENTGPEKRHIRKTSLRKIILTTPAVELKSVLVKKIKSIWKNVPPVDDTTVLMVRILDTGENKNRLIS